MTQKQRIVFLDWLRAAACLMVMLVHASECVYSDDYSFSFPSELARWSIMFIQGFVRPVAVPLFLMASAYLLVPVKTGTGEFLKKRFVRVGIPFVVFLFLYAFLPAVWGEFSWTQAWANVKQAGINFIPRESHLWFVYMMLGLYLIMPVISPWLAKVGRNLGFYTLLLYFQGAVGVCFRRVLVESIPTVLLCLRLYRLHSIGALYPLLCTLGQAEDAYGVPSSTHHLLSVWNVAVLPA